MIAGLMRAQPCGDSTGYAAPRRSMARSAALRRARSSRIVLLVVEVGSKAAQTAWKLFGRRVLLTQTFLRMADCTERGAGRIELRLMTAYAAFVSGESGLRRVICAFMADRTAPTPEERCVCARRGVRELGVILQGLRKTRFRRLAGLAQDIACACGCTVADQEYEQRISGEEK